MYKDIKFNTLISVMVVSGGQLASPLSFAADNDVFVSEMSLEGLLSISDTMVTAERREVGSQDVPVTLSVFNSSQIRSEHFNEPEDVSDLTPNYQQTGLNGTGGMGLNTVTIRGLGVSGSGNFILSSTSVLTYHDDIASGTTFTSNLPFFDLDRVEVLRGPQGTLFGRNAVGGVVKYHSASPTDEYEAYGNFSIGEFNLRRFEGAVSGPLSDNVNARVAMITYDRDGDVSNLLRQEDVGEREWFGIRTIVDWTPDNSQFSGRMKYQHYQADADTLFLNDARREAYSADELAFFDEVGVDVELDADSNFEKQFGGLIEPSEKYQVDLFQLNGDYDFGSVTLNSILGYMKASSDRVFDVVPFPTSIDHGFAPTRLDQESLELRLTSNPDEFGAFSFIAGLYYQQTDDSAYESNDFTGLRRDLDGDGLTRHNGDSPEDEFDGLLPAGPGSPLSGGRTVAKDTGTIQSLDTLALFFHTRYEWSDKLRTTHALRWTEESKDVDFFYNAFFDFPTRPGTGPESQAVDYYNFARLTPAEKRELDGVVVLDDPNAVDPVTGRVVPTRSSDAWTELTGKLGIDYKPSDDMLLYSSISRGFKGGSFVALAATPETSNAADPEISEVLELGMKSMWLDDRLQLNAALFYNNHQDFQATQKLRGGEINALSNLPKVTIKGAELQIQATPAENWYVLANLGTQKSSIEEVIAGNEELLGNDLGLVERVNFSGIIRRAFPSNVGNFSASVSWRYRGEFWSLLQNNDIAGYDANGDIITGPIGDFWEFNARLRFESIDAQWYADLSVENLTDEVSSIRAEIPQPGGVLGGTLTNVNARRNWLMSVGYRF